MIAKATNLLIGLAVGFGATGYHGITLIFLLSGFVISLSIRGAPPVET